ncbi:alpha/beta fold hydrolase [Phaeobacter sp.]|uniref:alpha/beta fold hydrolase n=1 Tax=Phaeobacter sp. TaxID=1902409 RepID=UPI0025D68E37|nr:alpha/beta fold hydrolase [Phaeobacter sp.]
MAAEGTANQASGEATFGCSRVSNSGFISDESAAAALYSALLGEQRAAAWRDRLAIKQPVSLGDFTPAFEVEAADQSARSRHQQLSEKRLGRRELFQRHFARAAFLRSRLSGSEQNGAAAEFAADLPAEGARWLLIGTNGRICDASAGWPGTGRALDPWVEKKLGIFDSNCQTWRDFFAGDTTSEQAETALADRWPSLAALKRPSGGMLLCQRLSNDSASGQGPMFLVEELPTLWSDRCGEYLCNFFEFDTAEFMTLKQFLASDGWIALHTSSGARRAAELPILGSMLAKTGATSYADMLRYLTYMMRQAAGDRAIANGRRSPADRHIQDPKGGTCHYVRLGADAGVPIIFLHGIFDGLAPVQRLQRTLRARGLQVFAPFRCGYGQSAAASPRGDQLASTLAQIETLIEEEQLERPVLLGHRSGSLFAAAAARCLRDKISGVVNVGATMPMHSVGEASSLKGHQRALAMSAVGAKRMLPFVVRSWRRSVRKRGAHVLVSRQVPENSGDQWLLNDPALTSLLAQSHEAMIRQGGAGYEADLSLAVKPRDMRHCGKAAPAIYLHGGADPITPPERLQAALGSADNLQFRVSKRAGTMLLYAQPDWVLSAVEEIARG